MASLFKKIATISFIFTVSSLVFLSLSYQAEADQIISSDTTFTAGRDWSGQDVYIEAGATLWTDNHTLICDDLIINGSLVRNDSVVTHSNQFLNGSYLCNSTLSTMSGALQFNGTADHIEITDDDSLEADSQLITFSAWVRPDNFDNNMIIWAKGAGSYAVRIMTAPDAGKIMLMKSGVEILANSNTAIGATTWSHIAVTRAGSGDTFTFYINGAAVGKTTANTGAFVANAEHLRVGLRLANTEPWLGAVSDVRIYNATLTPSQVAQVYADTFSDTTNLTLHLPLDNRTGTTAPDSSSVGNDGTLSGCTWVDDEVYIEGDITVSDGGVWYSDSAAVRMVANGTIWDKSTVKITLPNMTTGANTITLKDGVDHTFKSVNVSSSGLLLVSDNLTFTLQKGFDNSSGTINLTGTVDDYCYITGPSDWLVNASSLSDYNWRYVNVTDGQNIGTKTMVCLGEGYTLEGLWDFTGSVITSHVISEGYDKDTTSNITLSFDFTATDTSYLHSMNYTIYCTDNDTLMSWNDLDLTAEEVAERRWNLSLDVSGWVVGDYNITFRAKDAHNPPNTNLARDRAHNMSCLVDGEIVGGKNKQKSEDKEENTLIFTTGETLTQIYSLRFPGIEEKDLKQTVEWTSNQNFKMTHQVKVGVVEGESIGVGPVPQILGVKVKISAVSLLYLENSSYHTHFIINGQYFYDAQDFKDEGGNVIVYDKVSSNGLDSHTMIFTHPDWKKNEWVTIDPLSGAINENTETFNFTISESGVVGEESSVGKDTTRLNPPLAIGSIIIVLFVFVFLVVTFSQGKKAVLTSGKKRRF